jgi:HSP20 family protein
MNNLTRFLDRDEFLTPFDKIFDKMMVQQFPEFTKEVGIDFFYAGSYPKVDAMEFSDRVVIEAEIPGLKKEDLGIKVENDILTISGNKRDTVEDKTGKYIVRELKRSSFKRSFKLQENIDRKSIDAKFEHGMLLITLKKVTKDNPIGFEVKIG